MFHALVATISYWWWLLRCVSRCPRASAHAHAYAGSGGWVYKLHIRCQRHFQPNCLFTMNITMEYSTPRVTLVRRFLIVRVTLVRKKNSKSVTLVRIFLADIEASGQAEDCGRGGLEWDSLLLRVYGRC